MRRFRYLGDPLCLLACGLYGINRWLWVPLWGGNFARGHFNDLLLIPAALPPVLWIQRRCRVRSHDGMPGWREIGFHFVVWTVLFEAVGPLVLRVTGDPLDVLAYLAGALAAGWWWRRRAARSLTRDRA